MRHFLWYALLAMAAWVSTAPAPAQEQQAPVNVASENDDDLPGAPVADEPPAGDEAEDGPQTEAPARYTVGPGDVLDVTVFDDPELSRLVTVQHGGEIAFPLLGDVVVAGLSVDEIEHLMEQRLGKDFLVDPHVNVKVKEFRSQWVTAVGEVARPGKYYLNGPMTLLDLLTEAGGFTAQASGEIVISRLDGSFEDGGGTRSVILSRERSTSAQKEALSMPLASGDLVTATALQHFYISGEVKSPGTYPVTPGLTVLKAVSLAGGLTKYGSKGKVEILRKTASGEPHRIKADLDDIENGKKPDIPLAAQDIIKIGKRVF